MYIPSQGSRVCASLSNVEKVLSASACRSRCCLHRRALAVQAPARHVHPCKAGTIVHHLSDRV